MAGVIVFYVFLSLIALVVLWPFRTLPWFYRKPLYFTWKEPLLPLLYIFVFFMVLPFVLVSTVIFLEIAEDYFRFEGMWFFHGELWRPIWGSYFLGYSVVLSVVLLLMAMTIAKRSETHPERERKNPFRFLAVRIVMTVLIIACGSLMHEYRTFGDFGYDLEADVVVFPEPYRWATPDTYDAIADIASIRIESATYTRTTCRIHFTVTMTDGRTAVFREERSSSAYSSYLTHPTRLEDLFLEHPGLFSFADAQTQAEFMEAISWADEDPSNL